MGKQASVHPELRQLADQVKNNTEKIIDYLYAANVQAPSFGQDSLPIPPTPEIESLRANLNEAAHDLLRLVNGPLEGFRDLFTTHYELSAYQIALEFHVFEAVPRDVSVSLHELAETVGFDEDRLGRVLRMLATRRVFSECERDVFEHTASSVLVATDGEVRDALWMQ